MLASHTCILHLPKNPNQFFVWQNKCLSIGHKEKGRGLYREAFQPPVLCRRREPQRRATGACESLSTSKQKKSPYGSPAPQESIRTIQNVYSSCHQLGLVIYGNTNNIFPQPFDDVLYISIFMNLQRNDHLFNNFNSHCVIFFKSKIQ